VVDVEPHGARVEARVGRRVEERVRLVGVDVYESDEFALREASARPAASAASAAAPPTSGRMLTVLHAGYRVSWPKPCQPTRMGVCAYASVTREMLAA